MLLGALTSHSMQMGSTAFSRAEADHFFHLMKREVVDVSATAVCWAYVARFW